MKIPTVLVATGLMNAGGTESLIMETLRQRSNRIYYIMLIHHSNGIRPALFDEEIRSLGIPIVYIASVGSLGINGYVHEFCRVVKELGHVDILHSHLNSNGGVIAMAAKKAGIEHRICHCHADICYKGSLLYKLKHEMELYFFKLLIKKYATDRWACSKEAWHRLFWGHKNMVVIPNMIDVRKYLSSLEEKDKAKAAIGMSGKFIVGSVGRVARIKNYELAIETISALNRRGKDAHFVCYGRFDADKDAYCAELLDLAEKLCVSDKIHFMGNTSQVARDIKSFDVFMMPSTTEGFGIAALEAQAAGIPSLLSLGIPKIVDVGIGLAHFLPLDNVTAWADMVEVVAQKKDKIKAEDIISRFEEKGYDSVSGVRKIEDRYLQIIKK